MKYFFYKIYEAQPDLDAQNQCQSDGASLFLTESEFEDKVITSRPGVLFPLELFAKSLRFVCSLNILSKFVIFTLFLLSPV